MNFTEEGLILKKEAIKDYFILNGEVATVSDTRIFEEIVKSPIYEVIRVIDGIPLFFEEHIERMRRSSEIVDYSIYRSDEEFFFDMKKLIEINNVKNLNIKLLCVDIEGKGQIFLAYFIESYYPSEEVYKEGIHTILYDFERVNPNAKVLNISFKEDVKNKLKEEKAFEALLVNKEGYITEGSRSNMFFVRGDKVYTAPSGEVLLGVTRKHIVEVCEKLNIKVVEENIHVEDLDKIDAIFMSGTSVNVLPIATVDEKRYDSVNNKIVKAIGNGYLEEMKKYLKSKMD